MANPTISVVASLNVKYRLYLPSGVWEYDDLRAGAYPVNKNAGTWHFDGVIIPVDLITAARLRLIQPGDDSGIGEEQWAWIRLIGLTGESA